jgi:putative transposase
MARIGRVVAAGLPHHITQRGNRRQQTFFREADYEEYINLMPEWCKKCGVEIWVYCLLPNHVHLIAVPSTEEDLRKAIGEAHRRYTRYVNFYKGWRGYLWQAEDNMAVGDFFHYLHAPPFAKLNHPFLMA